MSKQQSPKADKLLAKFICCLKSNRFDTENIHSHMTMIFTVMLFKTNIVIDLFLFIIFEVLNYLPCGLELSLLGFTQFLLGLYLKIAH
jgi:hypothetical protein